jgi:hypothetical protein
MTIPQLIERGIDVIKYIPGVDTPGDNFKKIDAFDPSWPKFPSVKEDDPIDTLANYAIRPSDRFVDIDFDCDTARKLKDSYFAGGIAQFGRDKKGHKLFEISDPTPFSKKRIEFGDKCLLEMRGSGCYSVLQGKLEKKVQAEIYYLGNHEALTFQECNAAYLELGLICQFVEGMEGHFNDYLICIIGEMARKKMNHHTIRNIAQNLIAAVDRPHERNFRGEKMGTVNGILKSEKYSTIEKLTWSESKIGQVRKVIAEIVGDAEEYKKPQTMEWTALSTIMETDYPPIPEIVEGMLTPGMWFLAAKPKLGKSFLTMQLAHSVATGTEFLGRKTIQGSVLFVALEDTATRIKKRAEMCGYDKCKNIHFTFVSPKLMDGLEEQLLQKAKELGDCKLIIIDTFIRAKSSKKKIGGNDSYEEASFLVDKFQRMLMEADVCCMSNTHDKKEKESKNDDKVNRMTGSAAYQGQDGTWRLDRRRGGEGIYSNTEFTIVARDLPEQEYELKLNQGTWEMIGVAERGEEHDKLTRNILQGVQAICDDPDGYGDCKTVELVKWLRDANFIESNPENKNKYKQGDFNVKAKVKSMRYTKKPPLLVNSGERYQGYKIPEIIPEEPPQEDLPF